MTKGVFRFLMLDSGLPLRARGLIGFLSQSALSRFTDAEIASATGDDPEETAKAVQSLLSVGLLTLDADSYVFERGGRDIERGESTVEYKNKNYTVRENECINENYTAGENEFSMYRKENELENHPEISLFPELKEKREKSQSKERKENSATKSQSKREPNPMFDVIAEVTELDLNVGRGWVAKAAAALKDYKPEDIRRWYGKGGWWYTVRCVTLENKPCPSPASILKTVSYAKSYDESVNNEQTIGLLKVYR